MPWQQAVVAAVVAGAWISAATLLAERLGARTGGLVGNLPSNVLVSMVFVALAHGEAFAADAALAIPAGMTVDAVFLLVFVLVVPRGLPLAIIASLATWLALTPLARVAQIDDLALATGVFLGATLVVFFTLERVARVKSVDAARKKYGPVEVLARAAFAGVVVGGTVYLSASVGSYWTGLFATFPAVLLTTMVILARKQGVGFARATGKALVLGSTNIVVFAWVVRFAYPAMGVWLGTLLALAAAVLWVALLRPVMRRVA